jgi:transcriptional regulator with XRE-family HTH domain
MKSKNDIDKIQDELKNIIRFKSDNEKIEFETSVIQLGILEELQSIMDKKKISRSDLAGIVGKSKSFITQLFTGDKHLSLRHIAELQRALKIKIRVTFQHNLEEQLSEECVDAKINMAIRDSLNKPVVFHGFNQAISFKGNDKKEVKTA